MSKKHHTSSDKRSEALNERNANTSSKSHSRKRDGDKHTKERSHKDSGSETLGKGMLKLSLKEGQRKAATPSEATGKERVHLSSPTHPKKVDFRGDIVKLLSPLGRSLLSSYMASSSSAAGGLGAGGGTPGLQLDAYGWGTRLSTDVVFDMPGQTPKPACRGMIDSGSGCILADKSLFNAQALASSEVIDARGRKRYDSKFPFGTITGYLHEADLILGSTTPVLAQKQRFYVIDHSILKNNFRALLGIGPMIPSGLKNHTKEEARTFLDNVISQHHLPKILSIYLTTWNEDANVLWSFSGHVDLGGFDQALCRQKAAAEWTRRSDNKLVLDHYGVDCVLSYGDGRSSEQLVPKDEDGRAIIESVSAILDTGTPGIGLSTRMFREWVAALQRRGINFEQHQDEDMTFLTMPIESLENLKSLFLNFIGKDGVPFKVKIPTDRLVSPSRLNFIYPFVKQNHVLLTICGNSTTPFDVTLGIPFFQERYTIIDMSESTHYIGFAKIPGQTDKRSPELERVRARLEKREEEEGEKKKREEKATKESGTGKRRAGDSHASRKRGKA